MLRSIACKPASRKSADVGAARSGAARTSQELAFLPAALEIVDTPAPPLAGAIGGTLIGLFTIALAWACLGQIDIVASAAGKLIPSGRTKVVQPFETGVVRAIKVHDGESVAAGQVLVELDPTITAAERDHLRADLVSAELDAARLTAALSGEADAVAAFHPPAGASAAQASLQRQFLIQQVEEHRAKLSALDRQEAQKQAELATITASQKKLEAVLDVVQQRVDIRKVLYDHATGSKVSYLEILQAQVETEHELMVQKSRSREVEAALASIAETRAQTAAEFRRALSGELVEAQRKIAGLKEDLVKAEQRTKLQILTAPVSGTVQQLAVHTVGGVVTPAQPLLVVVPSDSHLEIEAMVSNRDIGFVHVGQDVEIKVDTFNFTRYGLIHGKVISVSRDAITREQAPDRSGAAAASAATSEPKGQELAFAARISLDRTQMQIDESLVNLTPGMAVTAEIRTGSRPIISYLLSPLVRYKQESMRER